MSDAPLNFRVSRLFALSFVFMLLGVAADHATTRWGLSLGSLHETSGFIVYYGVNVWLLVSLLLAVLLFTCGIWADALLGRINSRLRCLSFIIFLPIAFNSFLAAFNNWLLILGVLGFV